MRIGLVALLPLFASSLRAPAARAPTAMSATVGAAAAAAPVDIRLRLARADEIPALHDLEASSYPADEAASAEALAERQRDAGPYFRVIEADGAAIGFVCGTRCAAFTAASMAAHAADGPTLAVHSVVVDAAWRRRGVASDAIAAYTAAVKAESDVATIALIAKANLLGLYVGAGFRVDGLSPIVHGADPWFQCSMDARTYPCAVVDSFSAAPYGGNPAAVVFGSGSDAWMRRTAAEFALSETAFIRRAGLDAYDLRWWTPTTEVALCGHATLAAAHAVFEADARPRALTFRTKSGDLVARRGTGGTIELDFPRDDPMEFLKVALPEVAAAVKAPLRKDRPCFITGQRDLVAVVDAWEKIAGLEVDLEKIAALSKKHGLRAVCVCARGGAPGYDFTSRLFGPAIGIDEDPVTGSAHTALAPLFAKRGQTKLVGYQASPRGGAVACDLSTPGRVKLGGAATTIIRGNVLKDAAGP